MSIRFFSSGVVFDICQKRLIKSWLLSALKKRGFHVKQLNYVFCNDAYLLSINQKFLNHDYLTDIITFDLSEKEDSGLLMGELYISVERVFENAVLNNEPFSEELYRVMSHGVLHLIGFEDKSMLQKCEMRKQEGLMLGERSFHVEQKYKTRQRV